MSKRLDKAESMRKLRGIYSDALRAASCSDEFIAFGQSHTPFSVIGDRSVSLSKETLRVWSRHRAGARVALQQRLIVRHEVAFIAVMPVLQDIT
jgi:hypothetical protein